MSSETDLLSGITTPQGDPLAELVGEGKKFKDPAALAAAKLESDRFIEQLKAENAQMRKDLENASKAGDDAKVQALIERIEQATKGQNGNLPGTLPREEIEKLVKDGINSERTEAQRAANKAKANAELLNHFNGDSVTAQNHLKERVAALGLSGDALTEIAQNNPKMFRELFVPQARPHSNSPTLPPSKIGVLPETGAERGKSYYDKLKKDLGSKFWDPAIQQELFQSRKRLGEKYYTI